MKHLLLLLLLLSPTTPHDLRVSYAPSATTLSWSGEGPFLIYAGEDPTSLTPYTFTLAPAYTFSSLEPGETYYLAVEGQGGLSKIIAVNPPE